MSTVNDSYATARSHLSTKITSYTVAAREHSSDGSLPLQTDGTLFVTVLTA